MDRKEMFENVIEGFLPAHLGSKDKLENWLERYSKNKGFPMPFNGDHLEIFIPEDDEFGVYYCLGNQTNPELEAHVSAFPVCEGGNWIIPLSNGETITVMRPLKD